MDQSFLNIMGLVAALIGAIATALYVAFTAMLVKVTRRQAAISEEQVGISKKLGSITGLQVELQAQEVVISTVTSLAVAGQALASLIKQCRSLADTKDHEPLDGNPGIEKFFSSYDSFMALHFPFLRAQLGSGHQELLALLALQHVIDHARTSQKWTGLGAFRTEYGQIKPLLGNVFDMVVSSQKHQGALLAAARAARTETALEP
jgi:hypothetical protein